MSKKSIALQKIILNLPVAHPFWIWIIGAEYAGDIRPVKTAVGFRGLTPTVSGNFGNRQFLNNTDNLWKLGVFSFCLLFSLFNTMPY